MTQAEAAPLFPAVVVVRRAPEAGERMAPDGVFEIEFDRAMDPESAEYLSFDPPLPGAASWPDARTLRFTPAQPLPRDAEYVAELGVGMRAADGGELAEPLSLRFVTQKWLGVAQTIPGEGVVGVAPDATITVLFDRPVAPLMLLADRSQLSDLLRFEPPIAGKTEWLSTGALVFRPAKPLAGGVDYTVTLSKKLTAVDGAPLQDEFSWTFSTAVPQIVSMSPHSDESRPVRVDAPIVVQFDQPVDARSAVAAFSLTLDRKKIPGRAVVIGDTLTFTPMKRLAFDATYTVRVASTVVGVAGGAPMEIEQEWDFRTVPLPQLVGIDPSDGKRGVSPDASLSLRFNTEVDPDTIMSHVRITPAMSPTNVYTYYDAYDSRFMIRFDMRADTEYEVRVEPGIRDAYGNATRTEMRSKFRTGDRAAWMRPYLRYDASMFDARRPVRIAVDAVNVERIDVSVHRLDNVPASLVSRDFREIGLGRPFLTLSKAVTTTRNEAARTMITLGDDDRSRLPAGAYILVVESPQLRERRAYRYLIYVSDVNLVMKSERDEVLLWATDLGAGAPIAGLDLEVYQRIDSVVQQLGADTTDADGVVRIRRDAARGGNAYVHHTFALVRGERFAVVSNEWSGSSDWFDFGTARDSGSYGPLRAHLYTDRAIYRGGQKAYWRGVVRVQDDFRYESPGAANIRLALRDPMGSVLHEFDTTLDAFGAFSGSFDLPADAAPGAYYVDARIDDSRGVNLGSASATFVVADYRPPDFEVTVAPARSEMLRTEALRAVVNVAYLSGSALSEAPLTWNVVAREYDFRPPQFDRYSFRDGDDPWRCYDCWWFRPDETTTPVASGDGRTDSAGAFTLDLPLPAVIPDSRGAVLSGPVSLSVEANVTGADDQVMAGRAAIVAHPSEIYVGVATSARLVGVGKDVQSEFVTVDWQGRRVPSRKVSVAVVRREWKNSFIDGRWRSESIDVAMTAFDVTTDEQGVTQYGLKLPESGLYKITASTKDDDGRVGRSSSFVWVSGPAAKLWRSENDVKIDLLADKSTYEPGDTARILIPSPFIDDEHPAHYALVTVERGHLLRHEVVKITSASTVYELPIEDAYAPNVYVSVALMNAPKAGSNEYAEQRMGMVGLRVNARRRLMRLTLRPDRERAQPGETIGFALRATDVDGKPIVGAFSVDMVDKGILNLQPRETDAIVHAFYDPVGNSVQTASGLFVSAVRTLDEGDLQYPEEYGRGGGEGELAPAAAAPEAMAEGAADGADGDSGQAASAVRENFADAAYWRADVVTDRTGGARFEAKLPDNLTTWVVRAVGVDAETRVGEVLTNVTAALPLMIRPVTPRFFVVDDVAVLGAIVQNATADAVNAQVSLQAAGVSIDGSPETVTTTIPAASETLVTWTVRVLDAPQADLLFRVTSERYSDAAKPRLATAPNGGLRIERYTAPETVGTAGVLSDEDERREYVVLPKAADAARSALELRLDASLAAAMREGLGYLEHYPYECIEQIVSRFVPNVLTYRALDKLGIDDAELAEKLPPQVATAVAKLTKFQNDDGGWGWWPRRDSDVNVSAWAVYGLLQARAAGFDVSDDMLQRGLEYLEMQSTPSTTSTDVWQLNRQAWMQYVLAEADRSDPDRIAELFQLRAKLSHYGRALLILAMGRRDAEDPRIDALFADLTSQAVLSAAGMHWEEESVDWWAMNTDVRTTALALTAMARFDPQNTLAPNVVRWLMQARTAGSGYWRTTQETAWSLIALTDWMYSTGELAANYAYAVRVADAQIAEGVMSAANITRTMVITASGTQLATDAATRVTLIRSSGAGRLYYTTHLKAMLPVPALPAVDRGIVVQRRYVRADCADGVRCPSVTSAKVGDVLRVELTIIAPSDLTYLQLEDPLPAGAEAIDAVLATSSQLDREPQLGGSDERRWWWWNWWSHSELRDDRVSLFADWLVRGTYMYSYTMRITTAGEFNVRPTYAALQYFPEVFGRGEGMMFRAER